MTARNPSALSGAMLVTVGILSGCATDTTAGGVVTTIPSTSVTSPVSTEAQLPRRAIGWAGLVCSSFSPYRYLSLGSMFIRYGDVEAGKQEILENLGKARDNLSKTLARLDEAGPSPVAGGDEIVAELRKPLEDILKMLDVVEADVVRSTSFQEVLDTRSRLISLAETAKSEETNAQLTVKNHPVLGPLSSKSFSCV